MPPKKISSGVVHEVPADFRKALTADPQAFTAWEDLTPLARNEWICWLESAQKAETRSRRIEWGCSRMVRKTETRGETETSRGILSGLGGVIESMCLTLIGPAGILRPWRLATFFW